jgi:uncharacterized protein Yka (UPF0111/DUF47 family)
VFEFETQADVITQDVLILTRRSFITPFDRSDIKDLITSLDDSIDQMKKTAKTILLFEVETFEPHMAQMGDVIVDASILTVQAVAQLQSLRQNTQKVNEVTEAIIASKKAPTNSTIRASRRCSPSTGTATPWITSSATTSITTSSA